MRGRRKRSNGERNKTLGREEVVLPVIDGGDSCQAEKGDHVNN